MTQSNIEIRMQKCYTKCTLMKTNYKCGDQAEKKEVQSGQYLCCSHAITSFLLMTRILCCRP